MNARQLNQWINEKRHFVDVIFGHSLRRPSFGFTMPRSGDPGAPFGF
jgi:hypothetical protein